MQNNTLSRPGFSLSGTALKRLACLSMLLDHLGASLLENGLFRCSAIDPRLVGLDQLFAAGGSAGLSHLLFPAGGRLPPHPRSQKNRPADAGLRPHQRVALDWAFFSGVYWGHQNVYFTSCWGCWP